MTRKHRKLLLIGAPAFLLSAKLFGQVEYHSVRLSIREDVSVAMFDGISDAGEVFGLTVASRPGPFGFDVRPVRFDPDGALAWDSSPYGGDQGGFQTVGATANGVYFGNYFDRVPAPPAPYDPMLSGTYAATLTEPDHYSIRGRPAGGSTTLVTGASRDGQWITGNQYFYGGGASSSGIIFSPDHGMSLTGSFSPNAVNTRGQAVGYEFGGAGPATWTAEKGVESLPSLPIEGPIFAVPHIITESGLIEIDVETDPSDPTITRQFIFDGTSYLELQQPGERSHVFHVNNHGWATGYVLPPGESDSTQRIASLWIDGKWYNLNDLTAGLGLEYLEEAQAINDLGQIVVDGPIFENNVAAYLLTPIVPEPTAIAMIFASIPLSRRRR